MRFYKYIFEMNQLMNTMYEYNSLGLLAVSDYPVMSHNIIKSINLYVENVKKTLNVSRRKDGDELCWTVWPILTARNIQSLFHILNI